MFYRAHIKFKRACKHILDIERTLEAFARDHPDRIWVHKEHNGARLIGVEHSAALPSDIPLMIGDAVHNLRTALDHLVFELMCTFASPTSKERKHIKFPTGSSKASFDSHVRGMVRAAPQEVLDAMVSFEAFPNGQGDFLYRLAELDNTDKHTLLIAVIRAAEMPTIDGVDSLAAAFIALAGIRGAPTTSIGSRAPVIRVTTGDDVSGYDDTNATPTVLFGDSIEGLAREPVIPSINQLRESVKEAINRVTRSFS